ncbi:hypothetical protein BRE01_62820 [Brevibacillus reuszeri]|uniref:FRG domain-containing protein n=1 Tax=Brevibacillus reuszeri TaxID=54915 RepID=A0A0K9YWA4_9BACL|nr:FRG domain-containing protein [Brevibacillus reuszeri]KNB72963.1 hypothetical protein ADS79_14170 [Brevibacillus reuszeri]GED72580.1 hypothetical protein BRE01_62820 [Brevibacillus reuszeri]
MGFSNEWKKVLDDIYDFEERTKTRRVWYRGHSKSSYLLKSGLFRDKEEELLTYLSNELDSYRVFENLGAFCHDKKDWDLLFLMQHHGAKTRLLDWTESFAVALFFACASWDERIGSARVWLLNPASLNTLSIGVPNSVPVSFFGSYESHVKLETKFPVNSVAIYPPRNNQRILRQSGVFTVQGNTIKSLDEEFDGQLLKNGDLAVIDITPDLKDDAFRYLEHCGIDYFKLYPDLEGLAKYTNHFNKKQKELWKSLGAESNFSNEEIRKKYFE